MINKGIQFGDLHSFRNLNLVLSERKIPPAKPKTSYVDIPGGDGALDLTEAHGKVTYNDRDLSFTFTVHPSEMLDFPDKFTQISNTLNGKYFEKITDDKNPEYYFSGRCSVDEYAQDGYIGQIKVTAKVRPYKLKHAETVVTVALTETAQTVVLKNEKKPVIPTITCTDDGVTLIFEGNTLKLSAGTHNLLEVYLIEGENSVTASGSGTITFTYQEGAL